MFFKVGTSMGLEYSSQRKHLGRSADALTLALLLNILLIRIMSSQAAICHYKRNTSVLLFTDYSKSYTGNVRLMLNTATNLFATNEVRPGVGYFENDSIVINRMTAWKLAHDSAQKHFPKKLWNFKTEQAMVKSIERSGSAMKNSLVFILLHNIGFEPSSRNIRLPFRDGLDIYVVCVDMYGRDAELCQSKFQLSQARDVIVSSSGNLKNFQAQLEQLTCHYAHCPRHLLEKCDRETCTRRIVRYKYESAREECTSVVEQVSCLDRDCGLKLLTTPISALPVSTPVHGDGDQVMFSIEPFLPEFNWVEETLAHDDLVSMPTEVKRPMLRRRDYIYMVVFSTIAFIALLTVLIMMCLYARHRRRVSRKIRCMSSPGAASTKPSSTTDSLMLREPMGLQSLSSKSYIKASVRKSIAMLRSKSKASFTGQSFSFTMTPTTPLTPKQDSRKGPSRTARRALSLTDQQKAALLKGGKGNKKFKR